MNACVKPKLPFVAHTTLKRTPVSEQNKKVANFMDSHNFSLNVNKKTGKLESTVSLKK